MSRGEIAAAAAYITAAFVVFVGVAAAVLAWFTR
jgi:hypothetical protein